MSSAVIGSRFPLRDAGRVGLYAFFDGGGGGVISIAAVGGGPKDGAERASRNNLCLARIGDDVVANVGEGVVVGERADAQAAVAADVGCSWRLDGGPGGEDGDSELQEDEGKSEAHLRVIVVVVVVVRCESLLW